MQERRRDVDEGVRNVVNNSNRIDGILEARGRVASGITPGLLPWATGSDDLLLHKSGMQDGGRFGG